MSSIRFNNMVPEIAAASETDHQQLCYIICNFCNITLAVTVPSCNLYDIVTVRCGRCSSIWTVNMAMAAGFLHSQCQDSSSSSQQLHLHNQDLKKTSTLHSRLHLGSSSIDIPVHPSSLVKNQKTINHTQEKRKRVPSAYNQFIKQEIQRIKTNNPDISHRQAFSAAAKNWAHFPHIKMLETDNAQENLDEESHMHGSNKRLKSTADSVNM